MTIHSLLQYNAFPQYCWLCAGDDDDAVSLLEVLPFLPFCKAQWAVAGVIVYWQCIAVEKKTK